MKTKQLISTSAFILLLTLPQLYGQALPQHLARGPVPPGPGPRKGAEHPGPDRGGMIPLTTVSGTVQQLTGNDESILNGFVLGTGSSTVAVRFPAHMGQSINAAVKTGSSATASGYSEVTPEGESIFRLVTLTAGKSTVTDTPPTPPATLPTPNLVTIQGKVADFQLNKQGRPKALLLTDGTLVKVPPHAADQLVSMAPKGSTISVNGYSRPLGDGQVQLQKRSIIEAAQVSVNGQTFLVR